MPRVLIEAAAERDMKRLPADALDRIIPHLTALARTPRPPGCRKLTGTKNDWRIRVGDYRVLYEIDDPHDLVKILCVRHRREVYR